MNTSQKNEFYASVVSQTPRLREIGRGYSHKVFEAIEHSEAFEHMGSNELIKLPLKRQHRAKLQTIAEFTTVFATFKKYFGEIPLPTQIYANDRNGYVMSQERLENPQPVNHTTTTSIEYREILKAGVTMYQEEGLFFDALGVHGNATRLAHRIENSYFRYLGARSIVHCILVVLKPYLEKQNVDTAKIIQAFDPTIDIEAENCIYGGDDHHAIRICDMEYLSVHHDSLLIRIRARLGGLLTQSLYKESILKEKISSYKNQSHDSTTLHRPQVRSRT